MLPSSKTAWRFDPNSDPVEPFANPLAGVVELPALIRSSAVAPLSALLIDAKAELASIESAAASLSARSRDLTPVAAARDREALLPKFAESAARVRAHVERAAGSAAEAAATLDSAAEDDAPSDLSADALLAGEARGRYLAFDESARHRVVEGVIKRGDRKLLRWLADDPLGEALSPAEAAEVRTSVAKRIRPDLVSLHSIRSETAQLVASAALDLGRAASSALRKAGVPVGQASHYAFVETPASGEMGTASH